MQTRSLPRAALRRFDDAIALEVKADWPLQDDPAVVDWRVARSDAGRANVQVAIVRRSLVDSIALEARNAGISPAAIDVAGDDAPLGFNLLPHDLRPPRRPTFCRAARILAVLVVGSLASAGATHWAVLEHRASELDAEVVSLHEAARPAIELRARYVAQRDQLARLVDARRFQPEVTLVLDALADALPDGTWLRVVRLSDGRLTISGESDDAYRLIGALEAERVFGGVRFAGPVMRSERRGTDRFEITLEVVAPGETAA